ncbi:MAG: hypothetical protein LAP86_20475 [Acidobacteriia bacterium]|nr:hypothetical protein [Terriglobia bacterium]
MTPNELLVWISGRQEGSWAQFRGAVEALELDRAGDDTEDGSLPLHQRVRFNLERLGHVEFDAAGCEDGWRVVPPVLAISGYGGEARGVLCGARTPKLLEKIEREANGLTFERMPEEDSPDILRVHAREAEALAELAQRAGIAWQVDAPTALLSYLPRADSLRGWKPERMPAAGKDWDVKQFVIAGKRMKWSAVTLQEANAPGATGLFCFTRFQIPQYFLREGAETVRLPGAIAKYRILSQHRRRVLKYKRNEQQITVPAIFRPPVLTERALVLCSGFLPSVNTARGRPWLTYKDVPEDVAGMIAEVLRQDLL